MNLIAHPDVHVRMMFEYSSRLMRDCVKPGEITHYDILPVFIVTLFHLDLVKLMLEMCCHPLHPCQNLTDLLV